MKKYILLCTFLFSFTILLLIVFVYTREETFKVTTIEKAYNFVSTYDQEEKIDIGILINNKSSKIIDDNLLSSSYIESKNKSDSISLNLIKIKDQNSVYEIEDELYYLYTYSFLIPFKTNEDFSLEIKEAVLNLEYLSSSVSLNIGSFSFYKVKNLVGDNTLTISKLKSIVNEQNSNKTLMALQIGLCNNTLDSITIKRFVPLDLNVSFSSKEIIEINNTYSSSSNIKQLLGYDYMIKDSKIDYNEVDIIIPPNSEKIFLVPIKYLTDYSINKLGFYINYIYLDNNKTYFFDDFLFFNSRLINIEHLHILTYEND